MIKIASVILKSKFLNGKILFKLTGKPRKKNKIERKGTNQGICLEQAGRVGVGHRVELTTPQLQR